MMHRYILMFSLLIFSSCSTTDIQRTIDTVFGDRELSRTEVAQGLKEALKVGIGQGARILSERDGYYKSIYKINLPSEAQRVTDKLRVIPGFLQVEEVILEKINRAAEDAAARAEPIFVEAIRQMTFSDAMEILLGEKNAATSYLRQTTYDALYAEFEPVIVSSLDEFNAREYWREAVTAYNKLPLVEPVTPDLADYVARQALDGLFSMVEKEERNIRQNVSARTTELLRRVFARQDD